MRSLVQALFFLLVARPFMALFIGVRVCGIEHLPKSDPFLLIANHSSHLDTVALLSLFPLARLRKIRPVAAADYFERDRLVSLVSHTLFNILPVERLRVTRRTNPVTVMAEALRRGQSLILFPEGTRGGGGTLAPFHAGVAALLEEVPWLAATPVYLENLGRCLPKGEFLPVPFFCEARIGPPLRPEGDRGEVLDVLRGAVLALAEDV